jgi:hypothetical protein
MKRRYVSQSTARTTPELATLHRMLTRMDRRVKRAGPRRSLNETLYAFSHRLRARDAAEGPWTRIADWYLEYANLRYARTVAPSRLQHLQHLADLLR